MANPFDPNALSDPRLIRAADRFIDFCAESFDWRRNADEPFDEPLYEAAKQMVLDEIVALDQSRSQVKSGGAA